MCGTRPFASPTPRLADGSRNRSGIELGMNVGDVHQRDVAERIEPQQFVLRQTLLRKGLAPPARDDRRGRRRHLEKIAPRKHFKLPRSRIVERACRKARSLGGANGRWCGA